METPAPEKVFLLNMHLSFVQTIDIRKSKAVADVTEPNDLP